MRRGAWYEIVREIDDEYIVVQVHRQLQTVRRDQVTIRAEKPQVWSAVRDPGSFAPPKPDPRPGEVIRVVCPNCCDRRELTDRRTELLCMGCHKTYPIDWSEFC